MADEGNEDKQSGTASSSQNDQDDEVNLLQQLLTRIRLAVSTQDNDAEEEKPEQLLEEVTFEGVAKFMKTDKCKNIIVMPGAGVSTAAGIPDFRSPGTGLYDNLQKYNFPSLQSVFDIGYFRPTVSHYFFKLLEDKGLLLRIYTQNIDTLERIAGISTDSIVEAHGTFHTAHCLECRQEYSQQSVKDEIFKDKIPKCTECEGLVKPDIIFFGESMPDRFYQLIFQDMSKCDLLVVMGTSLVVQPFASLIDSVPETTPRLLINREKSGSRDDPDRMALLFGGGFSFDDKKNYRDVAWLGNTDDGCLALADLLGWKDELVAMVKEAHKKIDDANVTHPEKAQQTSSASQSDGAAKTTESSEGTKNATQQSNDAKAALPEAAPQSSSARQVDNDIARSTESCESTKNATQQSNDAKAALPEAAPQSSSARQVDNDIARSTESCESTKNVTQKSTGESPESDNSDSQNIEDIE